MYLNSEEERLFNGEAGEGVARCMKLLVTLGELFEAQRMVDVGSTHISGVSYKNIGEAGLEFLEGLAEENVKSSVAQTTLNPVGMDVKKWMKMGLKKDFAEKQFRIIKAFQLMGIKSEHTCTPYLIGNKPKFGEHVAWAESSATIYANSILGARTNRESGLSALASAIIGKTPYYGYHLDKNRKPTLNIKLEFKPKNLLEISALGYFIGKTFPNGVPFFSGLKRLGEDGFKVLGATLATSGAIALYHAENATPESRFISEKDLRNCGRFSVSLDEVKKTILELYETEEYDSVFLGCPHYSLNQIKYAANFLKGKKTSCRLWLCTSRSVFRKAKSLGYVDVIEKAGGLVLCGTCMVVSPIEDLGIEKVLTDSCKAAHYLSKTRGLKTNLKSPAECLRRAVSS